MAAASIEEEFSRVSEHWRSKVIDLLDAGGLERLGDAAGGARGGGGFRRGRCNRADVCTVDWG